MTLDQVLTVAPQIALALLGVGVLAFLISLRSFHVSRSRIFWRKRRAAGQRGWQLFIASVLFFALSGITCGLGNLGARMIANQVGQTAVAFATEPIIATYLAGTETARALPASVTATAPPTETAAPDIPPTVTATPTLDATQIAAATLALDATLSELLSQTLTAMPKTMTALAPTVTNTTAATLESAVSVVTEATLTTEPPTSTATITQTPTTAATATEMPSETPLPTVPTLEATATPSATATSSATLTATYTPSITLTPTDSPTPTLTLTATDTMTPTLSPTATPSLIPITNGQAQLPYSSVTPSGNSELRITALSAEITGDLKPINPALQFPAGIRRVYFFVEFNAMQPGVLWRRELRFNDAVILEGSYLWGQVGAGTTFFYFGQSMGFPAGNYEIRLYVGSSVDPIDTAAFVIN